METTPARNTFRRILSYFLHFKLLIAAAMLCSFVYSATYGMSLYLIGPFLEKLFNATTVVEQVEESGASGTLDQFKLAIQSMIDNWLGEGSPRDILTRLCILIIIGIALKNVFAYLQGYIMAFVEQGVVRNLRNDLYTAYHRLPLRYFQKRKTGELISRIISDCSTINANFNSTIMNLMREPAFMISSLFLMLVISWHLTVFIFLVAPVSMVIVATIGRKLRKRTTRTQDRIANMTAVLDETISSIRVVKAFAMEQFELARFRRANQEFSRAILRQRWLSRLAPPLTEFMGVSMAVAVLWFGGILVLEMNWIAPQEFLQYLVLMFALMQSGKKLSEIHVKLEVSMAASKRVFEIMDTPSDVVIKDDARSIDRIEQGITFTDVSYEYDPGAPVLSDINLDVRIGETLAIVGPSGGGKSTLVDLLPRFFDPVTGSVTIDGVDLREYRLEDLRTLMGIVTQETILFHDTIRANIAYGRPDIPLEDIVTAAKTANAHQFIESFEDGYDTVIGDRGTKLSGGQKQRIVIARAILKNPPILIFDEATSALDSEAESEVQGAIDHLMRGRTSFVIAHRLSTIQNASRIIVLEHGRIVESGTHTELMAHDRLYRRLYDIQFSSTTPK